MRSWLTLLGLALACALAACTNSTGGGTSMPGGQLPQMQVPTTPTAAPTPTPNSGSGNVQVMGDGSVQALPSPADFRVTAIFPKSSASPVVLNATVSVPGPPGINAYGGTGKPKNGLFSHIGPGKKAISPALLYVWFESDKNVTLASLPTLDFTIPLSALEPFGTDPIIGLAVYDPASENTWTKDIAQRSNPTPTPTPSGGVTATATATATATPTATVTATPVATPSRPPGSISQIGAVTPTGSPTPAQIATARPPVPSTVVRFVPAQRTMKLLAKKNLVFVLYAEPAPTPTPEASGSAKPKAAASSSAAPSASPTATATGSAAASAAPSPTGT